MKVLVIPDIHNRIVQAQSIMSHVEHDKCVLLGDYFDNFHDNVYDANNTAVWLRDYVLSNPKNIALIGNHDVNYFWNYHPQFRCSGYRDDKLAAIRKEINQEHVEQCKFYHIEDGWCYSHAGLTVSMWKSMALGYEQGTEETRAQFFERVLKNWVAKTVEDIGLIKNLPLLGCGWDRGGTQRHGGIIWIDWRNFASIHGINQMVGHTPHRIPEAHVQFVGGGYKKKYVSDYLKDISKYSGPEVVSLNFAIDTHMNHYAIVTDGQVVIYDSLTREPIDSPVNVERTVYETPDAEVSGIAAAIEEDKKDAESAFSLPPPLEYGSTVVMPNAEDFQKIIDKLNKSK